MQLIRLFSTAPVNQVIAVFEQLVVGLVPEADSNRLAGTNLDGEVEHGVVRFQLGWQHGESAGVGHTHTRDATPENRRPPTGKFVELVLVRECNEHAVSINLEANQSRRHETQIL